MPTLHYQLRVVMDVSFLLEVRKPSVDSLSMFPALQYTGYDVL